MTEMYMTLDQARKRVVVLTNEIEWIDSIINPQTRQDLEINIDEPPVDIRDMLEKIMEIKMKEKARFEDAITYAMGHLKLINIDGTTTKWNNNTPVWYDNE